MKSLEISRKGVGEVVVGSPLPESLRVADLAARYFVRYVADFQPEEGFRFENPPVEVLLEAGPFAQRAAKESVEPKAASFAAAAVKAVNAGARIGGLRVVGEGPRTATGLGVGSSLAELRAAHPDVHLTAVPPTLGGDVWAATLPGMVFLFASAQEAGTGGGVRRIDIL